MRITVKNTDGIELQPAVIAPDECTIIIDGRAVATIKKGQVYVPCRECGDILGPDEVECVGCRMAGQTTRRR